MKFLALSKEIREGKLDEIELIKCLNILHNQVQFSAINEIVRRKLCNQHIIETLSTISQYRDPKINKLFGIDTLGHYSIAALWALNTSESKKQYELLMSDLDDRDKEIVERIARSMSK